MLTDDRPFLHGQLSGAVSAVSDQMKIHFAEAILPIGNRPTGLTEGPLRPSHKTFGLWVLGNTPTPSNSV